MEEDKAQDDPAPGREWSQSVAGIAPAVDEEGKGFSSGRNLFQLKSNPADGRGSQAYDAAGSRQTGSNPNNESFRTAEEAVSPRGSGTNPDAEQDPE